MDSITIDNSIESSVNSKWSKPSSSFYDNIKHSQKLLNEAFLIVGEKAGIDCSYSNSGCKYPHHVIKDGKLVLSVNGVKAAYSRACQMGICRGDVKKHLIRHYKELDMYKGSKLESDDSINENFLWIEKSLGLPYLEHDSEMLLRMYGDTPEKLMKWLYHNIEYDDNDSEWKFRSFEQLLIDGKGNCHDQAAFEEEMLRVMGYNTGRVFFIEYNKTNGRSNKTHTLTWFGDNNSIALYWFENAWDTQYGIHGPYNGIEGLLDAVEKAWKEENNDSEYELYFSLDGHPEYGMNLAEYVNSWSFKSIEEQFNEIENMINDTNYIVEAGRSTLLKKDNIHDHDKELRYLIDTLPKTDKDHIGNGYWIDSTKVCYRRIMKQKGEIVGFIDVYHKLPKIEGNQGAVILAIDKRYQHNGFGKRLAKRMITDFKKDKIDVDNLRWLVDKDNEVSIRLAKSIGFEKAGETEKEYVYKFFKPKDEEINESYDILNEYLEDVEEDTVKNENTEDRSTCEFIPVFAIGKSYSWSELNNDGTKKSKDEIGSIGFSKVMNKYAGGDNYSHALISFNPELTDMYSFEHSGFVKESILTKDSWKGTKSVYISAIFVTKKEFENMKKAVTNFDQVKEKTVYAYGNFLKALFVKRMTKIKERQFCSSFVGYLLNMSDPKNTHRDYSRLRPEDMTILPRSFFIANPKDRDDLVNHLPDIKKKVNDIWKEHEEEIREYNNEIPKMKLKEATDKMDTLDKIFDWVVNKFLGSGTH